MLERLVCWSLLCSEASGVFEPLACMRSGLLEPLMCWNRGFLAAAVALMLQVFWRRVSVKASGVLDPLVCLGLGCVKVELQMCWSPRCVGTPKVLEPQIH